MEARTMGSVMRAFAIVILGTVACSSPNPDFCCVSEAQCAAAGVTDLRPCDVGQACAPDDTCVAAECTTSSDCTSAERPSCSNGLCIAGCAIDDDCAGVSATPHCDTDLSTCVGCLTADQCPPEA